MTLQRQHCQSDCPIYVTQQRKNAVTDSWHCDIWHHHYQRSAVLADLAHQPHARRVVRDNYCGAMSCKTYWNVALHTFCSPCRTWSIIHVIITSSSAIAERPRALQGGLVMAKSGRLELGDNIYGHYKAVFHHCDVFGQQSNRIRWKTQKGLLRRSRSFKVIEAGSNRKPVCDFLLVINSNWQPYRCGLIVAYCSNFGHLHFWATFGG